MAKIIAAFQVLPAGVDDLYGCVDAAIEVVQTSGLPYDVSSFETTIEGEYDKIMEVVKRAQTACFEYGADSVICNIKIANSPAGTTIAAHIGKYRS
jgi:uncharacterized protein YqgV (UPF0045/DUF77 family)